MGIKELCKSMMPMYFTRFKESGVEGLQMDLLSIVNFFRKKVLPAKKRTSVEDTELHTLGTFTTFLYFISYGSINTVQATKLTRQQVAAAMFDSKMFLRPPRIRDAILHDMLEVNPKAYMKVDNDGLMRRVREFLALMYGHLV